MKTLSKLFPFSSEKELKHIHEELIWAAKNRFTTGCTLRVVEKTEPKNWGDNWTDVMDDMVGAVVLSHTFSVGASLFQHYHKISDIIEKTGQKPKLSTGIVTHIIPSFLASIKSGKLVKSEMNDEKGDSEPVYFCFPHQSLEILAYDNRNSPRDYEDIPGYGPAIWDEYLQYVPVEDITDEQLSTLVLQEVVKEIGEEEEDLNLHYSAHHDGPAYNFSSGDFVMYEGKKYVFSHIHPQYSKIGVVREIKTLKTRNFLLRKLTPVS
jgi:hypothetical protein